MQELIIKTVRGRTLTWEEISGKRPGYAKPKTKHMAYNKFTLKEVLQRFALTVVDCEDVVRDVKLHPPSDFLLTALKRGTAKALKINTEKARSEMIVTPVLLEIQEILLNKISLFSGTDFNVDKSKGLSGRCDFLLSLNPSEELILAPVVSIVEAKKGDLKEGLGQCIAGMVAAQLFNKQEGNEITVVYGAVTSGIHWKFLKLQDTRIFIEELEKSFTVADKNMDKLLGIFIKMLEKQPVINTQKD